MAKRLAIVGAGTAGLITLHHALRSLPGWEVRAFHRENHLRGNWGNPYPGFVSTSTKFTTQFSAFRRFDDSVAPGGEQDYEEFFREDEYGNYLEEFVASCQLDRHVSRETDVLQVRREGKQWRLVYRAKNGAGEEEELFDAVVIATGLTESPRPVEVDVPVLRSIREREEVRNRTVVVMGGGESAADAANRLAIPDRHNRVYLSLRSGIRVSPRYHPIRGVPSDFLRNRLLLSIDPDLRNRIGQKFVEARIRHRERFERLFPGRQKKLASADPIEARKRRWDLLLTKTSKDLLFNTFHNKSDGFLDAVGEQRIQIIGPPVEGAPNQYRKFDSDDTLTVDADHLLPQLGYENHFDRLFEEKISLRDFYLGCQHIDHENLFLVGFARPIIGNIPTISEQQARYVTATLAGRIPRPGSLAELHAADRAALEDRFTRIDLDAVYPVEMFPYCDRLACALGTLPTRQALGFRKWLKVQLAPATTMHYRDDDFDPAEIDREVVHTPWVLNGLLGLIRAYDRLRGSSAE